MIRRQFIKTIRRYNHQQCEKNTSQKMQYFFENSNKKIDLIQKKICEDINDVQECVNIFFAFNFFTTVVLLIKVC